jgi:tRNA U38,U39,U40 pseudouridine synthase TruA
LKLVKEKEGTKLITELINLKDREAAGEAVPAQGLFLYKVNY